MLVLALDSSSATLSCALCELDGGLRVLRESLHPPPARCGDLLPAALVSLCAAEGVALERVGGIAVGLGPGSFTGLRVGLAAAKALAYALRIPVAGASSLRALAHAAGAAGDDGALLVPAIEARKGELYAAGFRARGGGLEEVLPEAVVWPDALAALLRVRPERALVFGPGAVLTAAKLSAAGLDAPAVALALPAVPPAAAVAALCAPALRGAAFDAAACFALAPNYLRQSEPEIALAEGRVGGLPRPKQ